MPDRQGHLSETEIDGIANFINAKSLADADACLVCGGQSYVHPSMSRIELGTLTGMQQRAIPVVMTVCEDCGFVRQFAASVTGILDPAELGDHEEGRTDLAEAGNG